MFEDQIKKNSKIKSRKDIASIVCFQNMCYVKQ